MLRSEVVLHVAFYAGLFAPALSVAQEVKPSEPATMEANTAVVVISSAGEDFLIDMPVTQDPTSTPDPSGGDDPETKTRTTRNQTRTIYRASPKPSPGPGTQDAFPTYNDAYLSYRPFQGVPALSKISTHLDPLESRFGISLAPVDDVLRSQLEIEKGQGVVVVEVKPGSLAEQAGLKPRDVLLSLGDKGVAGVAPARAMLLGLGKEALDVKLIREGKPRRMSLVGPEHGFAPESSEYWIGVPVSPVDATLRSHLTELPAEAGLIANDVVKESPADKAGVRKNDILVSMGGKPLKTSDVLIAQVQASGGKAVPLVFLRGGKFSTVEVTPAKRAHPTVINLKPGNVDYNYQFFQPNVAVEIVKDLEGSITGLHRNVAKPGDIQIELFTDRLRSQIRELEDGKLSTQIKELTAKVEELRKAVEGLKRPESR